MNEENENIDFDKAKITTFSQCPKPFGNGLLSKSSLDIKNEKFTTFDKIQNIILDITGFSSGSEIYKHIGLSSRTYNENKQNNLAKKTTKYALLGLYHEQQIKNKHDFTYQELTLIFCALLHYEPTRAPNYQQEVRDLRNLIIQQIMEK